MAPPRKHPLPHVEERSAILALAEIKPELNYAICMTINDLTRPDTLLGNLASSDAGIGTLPPEALRGITVAWNYSDGICAIITGIAQLKDKNNYRRKSTIAKGIINILSGAQLLTLTDNYGVFSYGLSALAGTTPLAGPAFAFAMLCDLINLAIDLYNVSRELSFEDWLEEKLEEVAFLQKRIEEETESIQRDALQQKKNNLVADIQARCRYYCNHSKGQTAILISNLQKNNILTEAEITACTTEWNAQNNLQAQDIARETAIQNEIEERFRKTRNDFFFKALSFIGMTLLAVSTFVACPPLGITATLLCSVVAVYYIQKNATAFFNTKKSEPGESSAAKPPAAYPSSPSC